MGRLCDSAKDVEHAAVHFTGVHLAEPDNRRKIPFSVRFSGRSYGWSHGLR